MAEELTGMTVKAIGKVRNGIQQAPGQGWRPIVSEIIVDSALAEALDGLDEFSHILVIYWMHRVDATGELPLKVHPMRRPELPLVGLLATRSPLRPNPLGLTAVRLIERRANVLRVEGLDALDGTPVIDIKPYLPGYDSVSEAKAPPWTANQ